jgi:hypothetical protein
METEGGLRLADVSVLIDDRRQSSTGKHDRVELLALTADAVLVRADTFTGIKLRAEESLEWPRCCFELQTEFRPMSASNASSG